MAKKENSPISIWWFILMVVIITVLWFAYEEYMITTYGLYEELSLVGDSFGGLNALFSGLAFAGIIFTILLQRKELQLQREELEETREELKRSADAQEKSQDALYRQKLALLYSAQLTGMNNLIEYHKGITTDSVRGLREKDESRKQITILKSKMEKTLKEIDTEFIM